MGEQEESGGDGDGGDGGEEKSSVNFGIIAHLLSVEVFNQILDIGWSRSGRYLYKPLQELTCCPQYTIRLDVHKFTLSRSQKRVLNTMLHFLRDGKVPPGGTKCAGDSKAGPSTTSTSRGRSCSSQQLSRPIRAQDTASSTTGRGEKKKVARRRRAEERLLRKGVDLEGYRAERAAKEESRRRTLESFLPDYDLATWKHRLEVRLVAIDSKEFAATFDESFDIYRKYQTLVHEDEQDELTPDGYTRFLVSSPLFTPEGESDGRTPAFGSYHQQFVLNPDGRIIAVGVVDILPRCFSSKYFYYDPAYKFLSLGTYSALREIAFTRQLCSNGRPQLHFYYMGFYLYDCPKMRYKGTFRPSDLLCDRTHQWVPLSECLKLLDSSGGKFTPFVPHQGALPHHDTTSNDEDINKIRCLLGNTAVPFGVLRSIAHNQEENLVERARIYLRYAGHVAEKMMVCF